MTPGIGPSYARSTKLQSLALSRAGPMFSNVPRRTHARPGAGPRGALREAPGETDRSKCEDDCGGRPPVRGGGFDGKRHGAAGRAGGATQADRQVSPESCLACERAANWRACHQAALTLAMEREWTRAIAVEEAVRRMQPGNAEVAAVLARMYQEGTRNRARAFELYHEALGSSPGYPPALLGLGTMMQDLGSLDVAARYFERGTRERPDEPQFKVRLADVLVKAGREEEARPILSEIVE